MHIGLFIVAVFLCKPEGVNPNPVPAVDYSFLNLYIPLLGITKLDKEK